MVLGQPDRQRVVAELRERIRAIEGRGGEARMRFSVAPDWLPAGCRIAGGEIHEVLARGDTDAAATAFAAALAGRLTAQGPVMWLGDVHGPGLTEFGLDSARLIVGRIAPADMWWTVEEATRCRGVVAVLASLRTPPSPIVGRRVHMCARASGAAVLLHYPATPKAPLQMAATRWRVTSAPSIPTDVPGPGVPRWRLELLRARGGREGEWLVEWRGPADGLVVIGEADMAAPLRAVG